MRQRSRSGRARPGPGAATPEQLGRADVGCRVVPVPCWALSGHGGAAHRRCAGFPGNSSCPTRVPWPSWPGAWRWATVSAGGEAGGVALDATGIGAILGVPVNVISAAGLTVGAGLSAAGLTTIVKDAAGPGPGQHDKCGERERRAGTGSGEPPSNGIRPSQEGDTNYVVDNPNELSYTVTDIDRIQDGTLWEEKTATGQDPRMNIQSWVQKNVAGKLDSYLRARQYLPGYEQAHWGSTSPGRVLLRRSGPWWSRL